MRKLSAGNKTAFSFFGFIIILIIAIIILSITYVTKNEKEEYEITSGTYVYDKDYNLIKTKTSGAIKKTWTGTYYLFEGEDKTKSYNLGNSVATYNLNQDKLTIYGSTYQVFKDATVSKTEKLTEITDLRQDKFYKLGDRKYVVVGNKIQNESGTLATKKYLIVILDKAGNTMLLNNELNAKTINNLKIKTEDYEFDVANEQLKFGEENTIDLKKIIGSTNEYKPKENVTEENKAQENETEENQNQETNQNNTQQEQVQQQQTQIINNQNSQMTNNQNINQNTNIQINQGNQNNQNNQTSGGNSSITPITPVTPGTSGDSNKQPLLKDVSLRSINTTCTYMDINYSIIDPENRYQTVYVNVKGDIEQTIALDKNQTTYRVLGLTPNTLYKVTLSYKEILLDGTIQDTTEDTMEVRTQKVNNQLQITKVAGNKLYFNFRMDSTYVADSAKIAMYIDDERIEDKEINIAEATSNTGWTSYFEYSYGTKIVLKLENVMYNGKEVGTTLETKFINY